MSLTKKLVLAFLLVTVVPLGVIVGVLHHTFVKHAEEQVGTRLEDSVIQVGKSMDEFTFSCIRGMQDLAEDPEFETSQINNYPGTSTLSPILAKSCSWTPTAR